MKKPFCIRCGNGTFDVSNQHDISNTIYTCKNCGYQGKPIFQEMGKKKKKKNKKKNKNHKIKSAGNESIGSDTQMASDKPDKHNDPEIIQLKKEKEKRQDPKKRITKDPTETIRRVSKMINPFAKSIKKASKKYNPFVKEAVLYTEDEFKDMEENNTFDENVDQKFEGINSPEDDFVIQVYQEGDPNNKYDNGSFHTVLKLKSGNLKDAIAEAKARYPEFSDAVRGLASYNVVGQQSQLSHSIPVNEDDLNQQEMSQRANSQNPFVKEATLHNPIEIQLQTKDGEWHNVELNQPIYFEEEAEKVARNMVEENDEYVNWKMEELELSVASKQNPFIKTAREFLYNERQTEQKEDRNMVFPEGDLSKDNSDNGGAPSSDENGSDSIYYEFDTVDRKEYHRSPNPDDFLPGHKEWVEDHVDKYYDGWLDDHIENSGGSIPGSNSKESDEHETTIMNLDEGQRRKEPKGLSFVTEKFLEQRHLNASEVLNLYKIAFNEENESNVDERQEIQRLLDQLARSCSEEIGTNFTTEDLLKILEKAQQMELVASADKKKRYANEVEKCELCGKELTPENMINGKCECSFKRGLENKLNSMFFTKDEMIKKYKNKEAKKKIVNIPICPNKEEHGKKQIALYPSSENNELMYCPVCKEIYSIKGNQHMEQQPVFKSKIIDE